MESSKRKGKFERIIEVDSSIDYDTFKGRYEVTPMIERDFDISSIPSDMKDEVMDSMRKNVEWELEEILFQAIEQYSKESMRGELIASLNGLKVIPSTHIEEGVIFCNYEELMNLSKFLEENGIVLDTVKC